MFSLPMDVRELMFRGGRCPDPRIGRNSLASDWVTLREWWFATRFALPTPKARQRAYLRTRGVDYLAQYFVNGQHVGSSESFNQVDYFDITSALNADGKSDEHELSIRLWPADPKDIEPADADGKRPAKLVRTSEDSLKATMFYGGDHNPFLYNAGIAIAPEIIVADGALVQFVATDYTLDVDASWVSGAFIVHAIVWDQASCEIELVPKNFEGTTHRLKGNLVPAQSTHRIEFSDLPVQLWQSFHLGTPHCYDLRVRAGGQEISITTGFRKLERQHNQAFKDRLVASIMDWHPYENNGPYGQEYYKGYDAIREAGEQWPDKPREGDYRYRHVINGQEIFVMGGSVVPPTLFWSDWNEENVRRLIRRARESNNNTLRVWGGGYLCGDEFFEEADLQGVMISHDFLNFAVFKNKSLSFQRRKEKEFRSLVRQVNAHPSVVVLNGGNELLQMAANRPLDPIFQLMKRVCATETTNQFFHLSCPVNPEVHGPWFFDLDHAARYNSFKTIFNSECGCQGAPSMKSLRRAMSDAELNDVFGATWLHRMLDPGYFSVLRSYAELFGPALKQSPEDVVRQTQFVQAIAYQYIAEEFRRQKPATSGFTTWEYNEPWVDVNWGILDSQLVPKHSFWTFARACAKHLISARFGSYVWAAGEMFHVELFSSNEGTEPNSLSGQAIGYDRDGNELGRVDFASETHSRSTRLGELEFKVPANGPFFLRLTAQVEGGLLPENDYTFFVLPDVARPPIRMLFLSGDVYENNVTHRFLKAAGIMVDARQVSPIEPLDARPEIDLKKYDVVVLGPIFNPIRSLGNAFFDQLRAAVEGGVGLVYFAYNTSAYVSGKYDVDELIGSKLEALLPVRFAPDHYGNSEDPRPPASKLQKTIDHAIWSGIDLSNAPTLGMGVTVIPRDGTQVIGETESPAIVSHRLGKGSVTIFTGPYGGHNYMQPAFRGWSYANRLLSNIIEFTATNSVTERASTPHPMRQLRDLPKAQVSVDVVDGKNSAPDKRSWTITVSNSGRVPVAYFDLGNNSPDEGVSFDWSVSENRFILFPSQTRTIAASAHARPGHSLPEKLAPTWSAWNLAQ